MESHVYNPHTPVSKIVKDIEGLDWNRQWDIKTSLGATYVNMTITGIEGLDLCLRTPEVPGYEPICMVETTIVNILTIRLIKESPSRNVYLLRYESPHPLWDLVYLSLSEKESIPTESFDTVLDIVTHEIGTVVRIWGNLRVLYLECDEFGICHAYTQKASHLVFVYRI